MQYQDVEAGYDHRCDLNYFIVKNNGKYGVVDIENSALVPVVYDTIAFVYYNQLLQSYRNSKISVFAVKQKDQFFLTDGKNKQKSKIKRESFEDITTHDLVMNMQSTNPVNEVLAKILAEKETKILQNKHLIDSFDSRWIKVSDWNDPFFIVYKGGKIGLVRYKELEGAFISRIMIPTIHDKLLNHNNSFLFQKGNEKLWYTCYGSYVANINEENIFEQKCDYLITEKAGKLGLMTYSSSKEKPFIIAPKYSSIATTLYFYDYLWLVKLNGKKGYINSNGLEYFKD